MEFVWRKGKKEAKREREEEIRDYEYRKEGRDYRLKQGYSKGERGGSLRRR